MTLKPRPTLLILCLALSACGADGPPQPPAASPPPPGLTLSGDAVIGVLSN